jgi:hypothetical protein
MTGCSWLCQAPYILNWVEVMKDEVESNVELQELVQKVNEGEALGL